MGRGQGMNHTTAQLNGLTPYKMGELIVYTYTVHNYTVNYLLKKIDTRLLR